MHETGNGNACHLTLRGGDSQADKFQFLKRKLNINMQTKTVTNYDASHRINK